MTTAEAERVVGRLAAIERALPARNVVGPVFDDLLAVAVDVAGVPAGDADGQRAVRWAFGRVSRAVRDAVRDGWRPGTVVAEAAAVTAASAANPAVSVTVPVRYLAVAVLHALVERDGIRLVAPGRPVEDELRGAAAFSEAVDCAPSVRMAFVSAAQALWEIRLAVIRREPAHVVAGGSVAVRAVSEAARYGDGAIHGERIRIAHTLGELDAVFGLPARARDAATLTGRDVARALAAVLGVAFRRTCVV